MENNKIILIAIAVLVIALVAVGAFVLTQNGNGNQTNVNATHDNQTNNTTSVVMIDKDGKNANDTANGTVIGKNNTQNNNTTYRVYNPQTDSYVTVIGEGYDAEVNRWYTYDTDGVRYYNTRIK